MHITIEFSTANAAFENMQAEIAAILKRVESTLDGLQPFYSAPIQDSNGATVGWIRKA